MRNEMALLSPSRRHHHHHRLPIINRKRDNSPLRVDEIDFECPVEEVLKSSGCSRHSSMSDLTSIQEEESVDQTPVMGARNWKDIMIVHGIYSTSPDSSSPLTLTLSSSPVSTTASTSSKITDDGKHTLSSGNSLCKSSSLRPPLLLVTRYRDPVAPSV